MSDADAVRDHHGLEVMAVEECHELLAAQPVGRLAFVDAGEAVVLPVAYRYHRHQVVFLTVPGAKLDAAVMANPVSFEIDGWDEGSQRGWSVLVRGFGDEVTDPDELAELSELGLKPWVASELSRWVRIVATELTGRRIV